MPNNTMTKQEQFLWAVQTLLIMNAINLSLDNQDARQRRHIISATGASNDVRVALAASERIPETMSAIEAAEDFAFYMLENLREPGAKVPYWFAGC
jgi:hypothetical protein